MIVYNDIGKIDKKKVIACLNGEGFALHNVVNLTNVGMM